MSIVSPRRLLVVAGLAIGAVGCSSQPATTEKSAATASATPAAPAATAAAPAPASTAAAEPRADTPAARRVPTPPGRWNGTPAEDAGKPGNYIVLAGKPAPVPTVKLGDKGTVSRIVTEGKNRNQVMDHLTHITTKIGPRLTGSANVETANKWAMEQFKSWGLESSLYQWGTIPVRFDRGPSTAKVGTMRDGEFRSQRDLEFTTPAWAAGTDGPVTGQIVKMPENEAQFEAVKDKLKGSWVLIKAAQQGRRGVGAMAGGSAARQRFFADQRAKASGKAPAEPAEPVIAQPANSIFGSWSGTLTGGAFAAEGVPITLDVKLGAEQAVSGTMTINERRPRTFQNAKWDDNEKTLTFTVPGGGGESSYTIKLDGDTISGETKLPADVGGAMAVKAKRVAADAQPEESSGPSIDERVFAAGPAGYISSAGAEIVRTGGSYRNIAMDNLPKDCEVQVRSSDYDYINSRVSDGATIYAEINCDNKFTGGPIPVYNTVAEIRGTTLPDEVVIVSAHLDSWNGPGSQGTTDNGTGSSVTLEAARILAAVGAKPKRTIRFILWTGEEQGLLGSRAYVKELKEKDQLKFISAVFVDDGGTNFEGGLHCLDSQVDYLGAATAPVNGVFWSSTDNRFLDVNIQPSRRMGGGISGGSSDHASFLAEKVPGYFWDEVGRADYQYGWHTQNDKLNLAIPEYLMQSSTCAAVTAYNLACAPSMLPREPFPQKEEEKKDTSANAAGN